MKTLSQTSLYYSEGRSDKEYHVELVEVDGGHVVNFRYGRRGSALTSGTKNAVPLGLDDAKALYDKLVKEKTAKGYTPDLSGAAYQGTEHAGRQTDFVPQLLSPITEAEAQTLLSHDDWAAQEKMDGERRAAHAERGQVIGANRKGLIVPLPQALADELRRIDAQHGTIRVDGEIIGEILYVFDLHTVQGECLHALPWIERLRRAEGALAGCRHLKLVPVAVTTAEKHALWNRVETAHGEGLVLKRMRSLVTTGRPNTGGDWRKYKFTESASCAVMAISSGKRSVKLGLLEHKNRAIQGLRWIPVGNVTIPPNQPIPAPGDIVEVNYLYAYPGGSLYQPVYHGKRLDVDAEACSMAQLKYKPAGRDDEI